MTLFIFLCLLTLLLFYIKYKFTVNTYQCDKGFYHAEKNGYTGTGTSKDLAIKNLNFILKDDLNA